ncbi:NAD(P)-dependent oxidoreductase [Plantactinospora sp. B6F1]|uniref:NAD(P)-dependent oxidoreductase n=1 Tax=Plantactinospora sp. B6F1 TaxID=3158971 RepID=UPI0032D98CC2
MTGQRVGFIGLGNMGGRMTRCLVQGGVEVLGFDTQAVRIAAAGADTAASAVDVVRNTEVVLLSLPSSRVVEAVMLGPDGAVHAAREGQIIVDLSTSDPASTRHIHGLLAARGVAYVDAGVSGGAAAAEKGELTLMVGGEEQPLDQVRPVLEHLAAKIFHLGSTGAGHAAKLLNNFLNAIALSATAEVMVAGKKAGLDLQVLLDVLNSSSGVNFATLNRFPKIIHGDYLKGGLTNTLMLKDVMAYIDLVAGLGVASLHSSGPLAAFGLAKALGYAEQISNTVVDAIGDVSGGIRLHDQKEAA